MSNIPLTEEKPWTEIISPKRGILDLKLKDIWNYRDLLVLFVKRDFAAQYKQTVLGPLWHVVQPIFTTLIFLILFTKIAKIPTEQLPPVLFYMSSLTIWNYFSSCLTSTSTTFLTNANIFGKVYFPRLVLPLSVVVSNIARFGIQFGLMLVLMVYYFATGAYKFQFGFNTLLIPVIVVVMAALGLGLGIIISSLTTKYRDFSVLMTFGVQLLMYITPVAYPLSYLENSRLRLLIEWNPLSSLVEGFRYAVFGIGTFNLDLFTYSIMFTIVVLVFGVIIFNKVERSFMDTV
jgi:lipopolysaccharide transport system permease protein